MLSSEDAEPILDAQSDKNFTDTATIPKCNDVNDKGLLFYVVMPSRARASNKTEDIIWYSIQIEIVVFPQGVEEENQGGGGGGGEVLVCVSALIAWPQERPFSQHWITRRPPQRKLLEMKTKQSFYRKNKKRRLHKIAVPNRKQERRVTKIAGDADWAQKAQSKERFPMGHLESLHLNTQISTPSITGVSCTTRPKGIMQTQRNTVHHRAGTW